MTRTLAAAAALMLSVALAGCGEETAPDDDPGSAPVASDPAPSEQPDEQPSADAPSETAAPADTVTVPVYFVGETPQGPRLYREFRTVEADNPLEEAVALMVAGDALDPDYFSLWPGGRFESIAFSDTANTVVAQVSSDEWIERPGDMDAKQARLAVQQLVYTVQGVQQMRMPVLVQDGDAPVRLFGIETAPGLEAAEQLDVLAFMNVTTPEEGAGVSDAFDAEGVGSSFEATVLWEVRDESGTVVLDGFTTAEGWMDALYPWTAQVDVSGLAPGTYTFAAITDDPSDGEGPGPTEDTKTITVG